MNRICVFCGSSPGARPEYAAAARATGEALAQRGIGLVYGGGNVGVMGILADAVLSAGGEVIGVIPEALQQREVAHLRLTRLHVVATMHERKALMADLSDGFVALPGGLGTFEELFEVLTWAQLGIHGKPCGIVNVAGYYDRLIEFLDHSTAERFVKPVHRGLLMMGTDPAELLDQFAAYVAPVIDKWLDRTKT